MTFKEDLLIFLNNTLIKLEKIENITFEQSTRIEELEAKIKEYEKEKDKLDRADEILETAKKNADIIINTSLKNKKKATKKGTK